MKPFVLLLAVLLMLSSCHKEDQPLTFTYTPLNDAVLTYQQPVPMDLDKDGETDFTANTRLIGSRETGDHHQFIVTSHKANRLLMHEETLPRMLSQDAAITTSDEEPYMWTPIGVAVLVEQVQPIDLSQSYWQGTWKDQQHQYLPVQLVKAGGIIYNGWIRISFMGTNPSRIILHDAAVSQKAGVSIKMGQK